MAGTSSPPTGFPAGLLERKLDELAQCLGSETETGPFLKQSLTITVHSARADAAGFWLRTTGDRWTQLTLQIDQETGQPTSEVVAQPPEFVSTTCQQAEPLITRQRAATGNAVRVACRIRQGGQAVGVLFASWPEEIFQPDQPTLLPYIAASAELVGDFLVQEELRQLRRGHAQSLQWDRFLATANACLTTQQLADHISHDGRVLLRCDRVAVLHITSGNSRILSVSGVDVIDRRSETVRHWEQLARNFLGSDVLQWHAGTPVPTQLTEFANETVLPQVIAVIPLRFPNGELAGIVIAEALQPLSDITGWEQRIHWMQHVATAPWLAISERELSSWSRWVRYCRRSGWQQRWSVSLAAAAGLGILLAAAVIPADLEVTASGELLPEERRDIFAPSTGVITEVHVNHGDQVDKDQLLLVVRDSVAELEATRVTGELATVQARLGVLQSARITALTQGGDASLQAQQLAAEEAELQQRLQSLTLQQSLLDAQRATSQVTSPLPGQVLTWDPVTNLQGRPIERGQVLLSIGNMTGRWVIEARVRERDLPELRQALAQNPKGLAVDVASLSETSQRCHGLLTDIARVTDVDERGDKTVRVTIALTEPPPDEFRPGASVVPKIHCGQRSLGYVWLRDLWQTLRRQWWLWS
ncbi:HlyD family efflux transporter periplasmic adaptor subunit [bacterium]|nr:HlyD family efflux transporter periplasmic adaptor subunit [bacterium]